MPALKDMEDYIESLQNQVDSYRRISRSTTEALQNKTYEYDEKMKQADERFKSLQEITTQHLQEARKREEALQADLTQAEEILNNVAYKDKTSLYSRDARNYFTVKSWDEKS